MILLSGGSIYVVRRYICLDVQSKYNSNCVISSDIHYTIIVRTLPRDTALSSQLITSHHSHHTTREGEGSSKSTKCHHHLNNPLTFKGVPFIEKDGTNPEVCRGELNYPFPKSPSYCHLWIVLGMSNAALQLELVNLFKKNLFL